MLTDDMIMYLLGMLILTIINVIAYTKMPLLAIVGIIGTLLLTPPTILGLGDYYFIGVILILTNMLIPFATISNARKGK